MNDAEGQRLLIALGYNLGKGGPSGRGDDGKWGEKSSLNCAMFQRGRGLAATGRLDAETIKALQAAVADKRPVETAFAIAQPKATRRITEIIIHCTATPEGRDVSVDTIRGWHIGQGWKDIGYHWVVGLDGVPRPGRPEAQVGSHVAGHNTGTLGVVYVGGVAADAKTPKDTRNAAQRSGLLTIVRALIARYPTITKVTGHNDHTNAKACPSFKVGKDELGRLI